jgi:hypothetical protein
MTAPQHNRFAIVPVPEYMSPPDEAIVVGDYREVMEYIPQASARADAERELTQARVTADQIQHAQSVTRALQVANFVDAVKQLTRRLDSYETEQLERTLREQEEADRKAAERKEADRAAGIKAALDALNAMDEPHHDPGGELHDVPPKQEFTPDDDNPGDLPLGLQEPPPEPPPELENKGKVYSQPISVSLNEA